MKLLRTIRLDLSDTFIFDRPADPGEWAVPGTFVFWHRDPTALEGKPRVAFRSGFLGIESSGWSTLVQIVKASADDRRVLVETLAQRLLSDFGAPNLAQALTAAEDEVAFAASLCEPPVDTLVAVHRMFESGAVRETFRTLRPRTGAKPVRAFSFFDVEDKEVEASERVDLIGLAGREQR